MRWGPLHLILSIGVIGQAEAEEFGAKNQQPRVDVFGDPLPSRATARFGTTRFREDDMVYQIAFSPRGADILSAGRSNCVHIWSGSTGKRRLEFAEHQGFVSCALFSSDGRLVVSGGSDSTVRVWDASTGKELACLLGHTGVIKAVAFSPDGKCVASAGAGLGIRLWDVARNQGGLSWG